MVLALVPVECGATPSLDPPTPPHPRPLLDGSLPFPNEADSSGGQDSKVSPLLLDRDRKFSVGVRAAGWGARGACTHTDAGALDVDLHEPGVEVHSLLALPFSLRQHPLFQELWTEPRTQKEA